MQHYRIYFLDESGHVAGVKEYQAAGDDAALEIAKQYRGQAVEIWDQGRKVGQLGIAVREEAPSN